VQDSGIGIPADQQQTIFEAFTQVGGQPTRKYGGAGLGLAISRRLAEMMGGEISVQSRGEPGKGSTFSLAFKNVTGSSVLIDTANIEELVTEDLRFENTSISAASANTPGTGAPQNTAHLAELLGILQGDLTQRWEKISKTHIIDEIDAFSREIRRLGAQYHSETLKNWGKLLFNDLQTFDMQKVAKTLDHFPALIKEIKEKASEG